MTQELLGNFNVATGDKLGKVFSLWALSTSGCPHVDKVLCVFQIKCLCNHLMLRSYCTWVLQIFSVVCIQTIENTDTVYIKGGVIFLPGFVMVSTTVVLLSSWVTNFLRDKSYRKKKKQKPTVKLQMQIFFLWTSAHFIKNIYCPNNYSWTVTVSVIRSFIYQFE